MKKIIKNKLSRLKKNKIIQSLKKEWYFLRIKIPRFFLGVLAGSGIELVLLIIGLIIEGLSGITLFSSSRFFVFGIGTLIMSVIGMMYISGFIYPTLEHCVEQYDKYNIDDKKTDAIKQYKSYAFRDGLWTSIFIMSLFIIGEVFPIANTDIVLYSLLLIPYGIMYHFVYKPARAGRLPKWLYRWLERKNPRMALPATLTAAAEHTAVHHDASVDNAEYTIVDDAPERADA